MTAIEEKAIQVNGGLSIRKMYDIINEYKNSDDDFYNDDENIVFTALSKKCRLINDNIWLLEDNNIYIQVTTKLSWFRYCININKNYAQYLHELYFMPFIRKRPCSMEITTPSIKQKSMDEYIDLQQYESENLKYQEEIDESELPMYISEIIIQEKSDYKSASIPPSPREIDDDDEDDPDYIPDDIPTIKQFRKEMKSGLVKYSNLKSSQKLKSILKKNVKFV